MNNLAIITARSGSKGLKDKNIKLLNGLPLMAYSIKAALDSGMYSHVMVSTDSPEYARIAMEHGAEVPFLRSEATSTDKAGSWDVVKEVILEYRKLGMEFDTVTLLQPTSPLRTGKDICEAYALYKEKNATAVAAMCEVEHPPMWCSVLPESLCMGEFAKNTANVQRQAFGKYYRCNGAIYIVDVKHFLTTGVVYDDGCYAYIMAGERSHDIDSELDFVIAEAIMNHFKE